MSKPSYEFVMDADPWSSVSRLRTI